MESALKDKSKTAQNQAVSTFMQRQVSNLLTSFLSQHNLVTGEHKATLAFTCVLGAFALHKFNRNFQDVKLIATAARRRLSFLLLSLQAVKPCNHSHPCGCGQPFISCEVEATTLLSGQRLSFLAFSLTIFHVTFQFCAYCRSFTESSAL